MLRDTPDTQVRVSQAEALVRSARLFLFDSLDQLWTRLLATGEVTMEARALARLAASHAVSSAVQAVDLMYVAGGASSIYVSCPLERAFRDVHIMTQHMGYTRASCTRLAECSSASNRIRRCSRGKPSSPRPALG